MGEQITVGRGKGDVVLRSLENVENELKNITQNIDSRDVSLVDRLSGLKYSHEDKIKKVKLIDEELLDLLEPKEYEFEFSWLLEKAKLIAKSGFSLFISKLYTTYSINGSLTT